jgi:hypothetical protein
VLQSTVGGQLRDGQIQVGSVNCIDVSTEQSDAGSTDVFVDVLGGGSSDGRRSVVSNRKVIVMLSEVAPALSTARTMKVPEVPGLEQQLTGFQVKMVTRAEPSLLLGQLVAKIGCITRSNVSANVASVTSGDVQVGNKVHSIELSK